MHILSVHSEPGSDSLYITYILKLTHIQINNVFYGIRTRVTAVKRQCPDRLDEKDFVLFIQLKTYLYNLPLIYTT